MLLPAGEDFSESFSLKSMFFDNFNNQRREKGALLMRKRILIPILIAFAVFLILQLAACADSRKTDNVQSTPEATSVPEVEHTAAPEVQNTENTDSSIIIQKMSPEAQAILQSAKETNWRMWFEDEEHLNSMLDLCEQIGKYSVPDVFWEVTKEEKNIDGFKILELTDNYQYERVIIYLHGGAYVAPINSEQINYIQKCCKTLRAKVYVPMYPLAPEYTCEDVFPFIEKVYELAKKDGKKITFMGDSAGGGLACAFCEYLSANGGEMPYRLILISPWLDVTMSDPEYQKYQENDCMLSAPGLIKAGELYSGNLDCRDYRISPKYGDVRNLPDTLMSVCTNEIFYPDIVNFYKTLKENGVKTKLICGEGYYHVYPLSDMPERDEFLTYVLDFIKE